MKDKNQKITKVSKFAVSLFMVGKQQISYMIITPTKVVIYLQTLAFPKPRIKLLLLISHLQETIQGFVGLKNWNSAGCPVCFICLFVCFKLQSIFFPHTSMICMFICNVHGIIYQLSFYTSPFCSSLFS